MRVWHQTADAGQRAVFEDGRWWLHLEVGIWPIEPGRTVQVDWGVQEGGPIATGQARASWDSNRGANGYWRAKLGPFDAGAAIEYSVVGRSPQGEASAGPFKARVGPRLFLALLWHQHPPLYLDCLCPQTARRLLLPWVRLHALRDYYSMAALVERHPNLRLTINLTPVLLQQLAG